MAPTEHLETVNTLNDAHLPGGPEYFCLLKDEPLTRQLGTKVRVELRHYHRFYRRDYLCRRMTKTHWTSEYPWMLKLGTRTPTKSTLDTQRLQQFCKKPTTLYWTPSAQPNNTCPLVPFGCIYKEWFRCYGGEPAFEFGAFFANPVRIMPTGPTTIPDILDTHKALCSEVSWKANSLNRCNPHRTCENACPHPQNYRFFPLCRAVIVVLDEYADDSGHDCEDEDGNLLYDKFMHKQNVLVVLTGDDRGLSAPIDLRNVRAQKLPLSRTDIHEGIEVIRVPLVTTVNFIANLLRREETAFPDLVPSSIERGLCPGCGFPHGSSTDDEFADMTLQLAAQNGISNVIEAQSALERIQARERGETRLELVPDFFSSRCKWRPDLTTDVYQCTNYEHSKT